MAVIRPATNAMPRSTTLPSVATSSGRYADEHPVDQGHGAEDDRDDRLIGVEERDHRRSEDERFADRLAHRRSVAGLRRDEEPPNDSGRERCADPEHGRQDPVELREPPEGERGECRKLEQEPDYEEERLQGLHYPTVTSSASTTSPQSTIKPATRFARPGTAPALRSTSVAARQ